MNWGRKSTLGYSLRFRYLRQSLFVEAGLVGFVQLQVRWDPVRLDGRDICPDHFGIGILVGEIAISESVKRKGLRMLRYLTWPKCLLPQLDSCSQGGSQ